MSILTNLKTLSRPFKTAKALGASQDHVRRLQALDRCSMEALEHAEGLMSFERSCAHETLRRLKAQEQGTSRLFKSLDTEQRRSQAAFIQLGTLRQALRAALELVVTTGDLRDFRDSVQEALDAAVPEGAKGPEEAEVPEVSA